MIYTTALMSITAGSTQSLIQPAHDFIFTTESINSSSFQNGMQFKFVMMLYILSVVTTIDAMQDGTFSLSNGK